MASEAIAAECRVFARHLVGAEPTPYVLACYERLLSTANVAPRESALLIERALLGFGRAGGFALRMADGYACVLRPRGALRRRLILLFAILENSPTTAHLLNTGDVGSFAGVSLRMVATMTASVLCTLAGLVVLGPVHALSAALAPSPRDDTRDS